jgi:DNA polymerase III delta prime subunit
MATQSLYRRYRPRRFGELKGQDHVVRALRDAVRSGREGQAYLFSGPRGTGKTTSARILAKVLNCDARSTASRAASATPASRSSGARATTSTSSTPPATTGSTPSATSSRRRRSARPGATRCTSSTRSTCCRGGRGRAAQDARGAAAARRVRARHHRSAEDERHHPESHPAPAVPPAARPTRSPSTCGGWPPTPGSISTTGPRGGAVTRGGGSARDTLSALELMAATGGDTSDVLEFDEFVRAMIDHEPGTALTAIAHAVGLGHEPRTLTEALVRHLRDGFLALMAPELVQLPQPGSIRSLPRPSSWAPRRSCGPSSGSAPRWSTCATPPIRACCSRWRSCSSPTTPRCRRRPPAEPCSADGRAAAPRLHPRRAPPPQRHRVTPSRHPRPPATRSHRAVPTPPRPTPQRHRVTTSRHPRPRATQSRQAAELGAKPGAGTAGAGAGAGAIRPSCGSVTSGRR